MNTELKHREEQKRDRRWHEGERWRLIRQATAWAENQTRSPRHTKTERLAEQQKKLAYLRSLLK